METLPILAAIAATYLLAGFVKGAIGLGLPTVAIGLLGLMMSPSQAAAILVAPSLVTNIWQGVSGGPVRVLLRRLWPLLTGICLGTVAGVILLPNGGSGQATRWLGIALAFYAALGLFKIHVVVPPRAELWLGLVAGVATGAITVATGVFAVPSVAYIEGLKLERDALVQALGISFTTSTVTLALALMHAGEMTSALAWPSLLALVAAIAGMAVGQVVRGRVKAATFRSCFFFGLLLLGAHLALRGLL